MSPARWNSTVTPGGLRSAARYWRGLLRSTLSPQFTRNRSVSSSMPLLGRASRSSSIGRRSAAFAISVLPALHAERPERRGRQLVKGNGDLLARRERAEDNGAGRALIRADQHGEGDRLAGGVAKRGPRSPPAQVQLHAEPLRAQRLRRGDGTGPVGGFDRNDQDLRQARYGGERGQAVQRQFRPFQTNGKPTGRYRVAAAQRAHEIVVAPTTAELEPTIDALVIDLEDQASVVAQAAGETQVHDQLARMRAVGREQRQGRVDLLEWSGVQVVIAQQGLQAPQCFRWRAGEPVKLLQELDRRTHLRRRIRTSGFGQQAAHDLAGRAHAALERQAGLREQLGGQPSRRLRPDLRDQLPERAVGRLVVVRRGGRRPEE